MSRIVAIRKNKDGSIGQYKLDDGRILSEEEAVAATGDGQIEGVSIFTTRDNRESIRSNRGQSNYSLSNLPEF